MKKTSKTQIEKYVLLTCKLSKQNKIIFFTLIINSIPIYLRRQASGMMNVK